MLAILFWIVSPRFEWKIPPKWEAVLKNWKGKLSNESEGYVVRESFLEDEEMEKRFWLLRKELAEGQQYSKGPIRVEIPIEHNLSADLIGRYIACLERRFPDMTICVTVSSLKDSPRDRV